MYEDKYVVDFECTDNQAYSRFFKTYEEAYNYMLKHVKVILNNYGPYIVEKDCGCGGAQLVIHFPDSLYVCNDNTIEVNWRIYKL